MIEAAGNVGPRQIVVGDPPTVAEGLDLVHMIFPRVLEALSAGIHVYLYGPAGTGKTTIGDQCATALGVPFSFESFSPDKDSTCLLGFVDAGGTYHGTEFQRLYQNGGVFLFDEIDNCDSSILAVLNSALANGKMVFPGIGMIERNARFRAVAAGNTWGQGPDSTYIGRTALDAATLNRFVSIHVAIDRAIECLAAGLPYTGPRGSVEMRPRPSEAIAAKATAQWAERVERYRARVESLGLQVVVSPRATIYGAKLIRVGWGLEELEAGLIFRGFDPGTVGQIRSGS